MMTSMNGLVLPDDQDRNIRLDDEIAKSAATALLTFRGTW